MGVIWALYRGGGSLVGILDELGSPTHQESCTFSNTSEKIPTDAKFGPVRKLIKNGLMRF